MTLRSKMPPDTVCIPEIFEDDQGRWWRVCLTCDDGSNKFGRNPRGHRTEADARMSFRDHAAQLRKNRQAYARYLVWRARVLAASSFDEFYEIWYERHPQYRPAVKPEATPEREALFRDIQERMRGENSSTV